MRETQVLMPNEVILRQPCRRGVDGLGASRSGDDYLKWFDSSGSFATGNLWFARYHTLNEHRRRPAPAYRQRTCRLHAR